MANNPMGAISSYFTTVMVVLYLRIGAAYSLHISECKKPEKGAALFIFGDSYFDVGNNNYINTSTLDQAHFWPYGQSYFKSPTGRFSDGRLISDFIAEYANVPVPPPFLQPGNEEDNYVGGANFASAGAGSLVQTFEGATQVNNYKKVKILLRNKLGSSKSDKIFRSGVYLISIGTNDYLSPFLTNSTVLTSYSRTQYVQMVIGNLTTVIEEIYKNGGRKFGFLNLGDLGCLPGLRMLNPPTKNGCLEEASKLAKLHNLELHILLLRLQKKFKGFTYSLYDYNRSLRQRMNHPSRHGLKEGKRACCGTGRFRGICSCGGKRPVKQFEVCKSPNKHVFWDSYHLTQTIYQQMAAEMWNGPLIGGPSTLKTLFQCL
ncbi:GDSL esterase/lipase 5-like isoform X2 [Lycium barbarum]|uniref:GDSL esterase/lipase 5-like isoform X2 n=1 Tax=Lycium barbarum TaxID=112863 RepID=UPI00293E9455|nr:GDSL esterase/lipase 5-like isoform X2 [Lycium barbarum]